MLNIPVPPQAVPADAIAVAIVAGGMIAGAALLLWGRKLHRALLALAGAGVGWEVGCRLSGSIPVAWQITAVGAMLVAAVIGVFLARLLWALIAGALAGAVTYVVLLNSLLAKLPEKDVPAFGMPAGGNLNDWAMSCWPFARDCFEKLWATESATLLIALSVTSLAVLLVAILRPQLASIFLTSLLGGAAIAAGGTVIAGRIEAGLWPGEWSRWLIPASITGVLLIAGLTYQYRGAFREARETRDGAPPEKPKSKSGGSAEK